MSGQLRLEGTLTVGPKCVGADRSLTTISLLLAGGCCSKSFGASSGVVQADLPIAAATAYVALPGIGTAPAVTHATFLYFFASSPILLRFTTDDGAGGSVVIADVPLDGLLVQEFSSARFLKLLEVKGSGSVEYLAAGPS